MCKDEAFEKVSVGDDLATGRNVRRFRAKFYALANQQGLNADDVWGFYKELNKNPGMDQKAYATDKSINWAGLAAFMATLAPIIEQMMASCPSS